MALPRIVGFAVEHWLSIPGLEKLYVDIEQIGAGQARLREVQADYRSTAGHLIRIALRDIRLDYSPALRKVTRVEAGSGELDVYPGASQPASPWPEIVLPVLPVAETRIGTLHLAVHAQERPVLEATGRFILRQTEERLDAEFNADAARFQMAASQSQAPGGELEINAKWTPANGTESSAGLRIGRQPTQQPATLAIDAPLAQLAELARSMGVVVPLSVQRGSLKLQVEARLGENAGALRAFSVDADLTDAAFETAGMAAPLALAIDGKLHYEWQASAMQLALQPGFRWQTTLDGANALQAGGRLEKSFTVKQSDGASTSEGTFPFTLRSSQWGEWNGEVRRFGLTVGAGQPDISSADAQIHLKGQMQQWQKDALRVQGLQVTGDARLRWARPTTLNSDLVLQIGANRLAWSGDAPLTVNNASWKVSTKATAKTGADFLKSLTLTGEAISPQLKVERGAGEALTLGSSRLQFVNLRPTQTWGVQGALVLAVDAIKFGTWPSPAVRARINLDGKALTTDGTLLLQGKDALHFAGSHSLVRECGEARVTAQHSLQALGTMLQPRPPALLPLKLQAGSADARFALNWCAQADFRFDAKGTLEMRDAALGWERARIETLQATLQLDGLQPMRGSIRIAAQRGELATGTSLSDLNVVLTLSPTELAVNALHAGLLGGTVQAEPITLPWPSLERPLPLRIHRFDLGQLLALPAVQGLSGSGQLDGVLPLTYRDGGVEINDGQLNSHGTGTIRYSPTLAIPDNPGLQALRNFQFRQLGTRVWYASDGAYRMQAKLEGHNPDFYNGYPIRFGLNINGELPGLFRSALFSGDFNRHILEQLQSGKLE